MRLAEGRRQASVRAEPLVLLLLMVLLTGERALFTLGGLGECPQTTKMSLKYWAEPLGLANGRSVPCTLSASGLPPACCKSSADPVATLLTLPHWISLPWPQFPHL